MKGLLYGFPAFSEWAIVAGVLAVGIVVGITAGVFIGKYIQKTREPQAWRRAREFQSKINTQQMENGELKARLEAVRMAATIL